MTVPNVGQEPWGEDLNSHLAALEARIAALEVKKEHIYNSYSWKFSAAAPPALAGEVRLNNVAANLATLIDFRKIDGDGADRTPVFSQITADDIIRINDWDNADIVHRYRVTGPPTIDATNVQVPVAWTSGNGTLPTAGTAKINVGFLLSIAI